MLRRVLKTCLMIILVPAFVILKLAEGICNLAQLLSGWIFRVFGLIILATAAGCWFLHLEETHEVLHMCMTGVGVFLLPMIGELLIAGIVILELLVKRAMSA